MSRAEEAALKAYPKEIRDHTGLVVDIGHPQWIRNYYIQGYEQAEKDLSLTWEDMQKIYKIICGTDAELDSLSYGLDYQEYWEEVLRRFNKAKEG